MWPVRVMVVGGGIEGLSAALALRAAGAEVKVYEQAAELGEVGAGVGLYPNSMRILHRLGVADSIIRHGAPIDGWWMRAPGGSVLSNQVAGRDGPIGFLGMYRPDLVAALMAGLPRGVLHTGHRCVAFSQDDRSAVVTFDNGVSVEADVVVAADGIHSTLQRYVVRAGPCSPVWCLSRGDACRQGARLDVATRLGELGGPGQALSGVSCARGHVAQLCRISACRRADA